jgi:hypothetical protein
MLRNNISDFNINPLLSELDNVIRKHMNIMLNEYIGRFNLLEQTHRQIMNLPSVVDELRRYSGATCNSACEKSCSPTSSDNSSEQLRQDVAAIKNKLDSIESYLQRNATTATHAQPNTTSNSVQPSIVLSCVNENIHFEMKEEEICNSDAMCCADIDADIESGADEEEEEEDDEDEEEEEEEEPVTTLCKNQDCSPVKDAKFTEKCSICSGHFADDGLNDVYFLNENGGVGSCNLCKKTENVCIMKGTGQYVCINACDEEEEEEEEEVEKTRIPVKEEEEVETEEEEEEVETEEEEEEEEEKKEVVEEEEEELVEIEIDDITYCTNDEENGFIYELSEEGEVGEKVGYLKDGEPFFYAEEN